MIPGTSGPLVIQWLLLDRYLCDLNSNFFFCKLFFWDGYWLVGFYLGSALVATVIGGSAYEVH